MKLKMDFKCLMKPGSILILKFTISKCLKMRKKYIKNILKSCLVMLLTFWGGAGLAQDVDFMLGVCTHFGQNRSYVEVGKALIMLNEVKANSFRDVITWDETERNPGVYVIPKRIRSVIDLLGNNGKEAVVILAYGNKAYGSGFPIAESNVAGFSKFAAAVAMQLKGKVRYFEIWNEWNKGFGSGTEPKTHGDPLKYAALLSSAYKSIKEVNSDAIVLGGAVGGVDINWIRGFVNSLGSHSMDGFSIHPYNFGSTRNGTGVDVYESLVSLRSEYFLSRGFDIPFYITEINWPTHFGRTGRKGDESAANMLQLYFLAKYSGFIHGIWMYELYDGDSTSSRPMHNFGIYDSSLAPKPHIKALSDLPKVLNKKNFLKKVTLDVGLYDFSFKENSESVHVLFSKDGTKTIVVKVLGPRKHMHVRRLDLIAGTDESIVIRDGSEIQVTNKPIIISVSADIADYNFSVR